MWNSFAKLGRLEKALDYNKLDPESLSVVTLFKTLERRGISDSELNKITWLLLAHLEPPSCQKGHCEHYGGQSAFCDCSLGRIPGRCKENREFIKRRAERKAIWIDKAMSEALCHLPEERVKEVDWETFWNRHHGQGSDPAEKVRMAVQADAERLKKIAEFKGGDA